MDSCLGHILESTKWIEIKQEDKKHNPILNFT